MRFRHIRRGGTYFRIADAAWRDTLDGRFAKARGGRWNPAGSFAVVYLNATVDTARANIRRRFAGQPFAPDDLNEERLPVLIESVVPEAAFIDIVSDAGCRAAALPMTYPFDRSGNEIPHDRCQPIGRDAFNAGGPGIACRSAAITHASRGENTAGEELAWFQRDERLTPVRRATFDQWFYESDQS